MESFWEKPFSGNVVKRIVCINLPSIYGFDSKLNIRLSNTLCKNRSRSSGALRLLVAKGIHAATGKLLPDISRSYCWMV